MDRIGSRIGGDTRSGPARSSLRRLGNRSVQSLVERGTLGRPDGRLEREADRVAREVLRAPKGGGGGQAPGPAGWEANTEPSGPVREARATAPGPAGTGFGTGRPLPPSVRSFFEPRFGTDFGGVRVHADDRADEAARSLNARAFATGRDLVFGEGEYRPATTEGRRLLAHELAHVTQQASGGRLAGVGGRGPAIQREPAPIVDYLWPLETAMRFVSPQVVVDMTPPRRPSPDHSTSKNRLGAWEHANLGTSPQLRLETEEATDPQGRTISYVTSVAFDLNPTYEYRIAEELWTNSQRRASTGSPQAMAAIKWRQVYDIVREHADEHFARYAAVLRTMEGRIETALRQLPSGIDPVAVSEAVLQSYVEELVRHYNGRINYLAWERTCDWERTDYPRVERRVNAIPGAPRITLVPACGTPPSVPPEPTIVRGRSTANPSPSSGPSGTTGGTQGTGSGSEGRERE